MSRTIDLIFGLEHTDTAPNAVEDLVDENEAVGEDLQDSEKKEDEQEETKPKHWKRRQSAYVTVFEEITNEIIDHELTLLSEEERNIFTAFSQLSYQSRYSLTRLLQRNAGGWHPFTSMDKFKKEIRAEGGLEESLKNLCSMSGPYLLSLLCDSGEGGSQTGGMIIDSGSQELTTKRQEESEIIDLTLDSDDEDEESKPKARTSNINNDHSMRHHTTERLDGFYFCDDESKMTLEEALRRLSADHLHALAKDFKCWKPKCTKEMIVLNLLNHARGQAVLPITTTPAKGKAKAKDAKKHDNLKQQTLFGTGFMKKKSQEDVLLKKAKERLGPCVRINPAFHELVIRMNIIYYRSTEVPEKPFTPSLLTVFKKRTYPQYTHNRSVIWKTREDFLEYENAVRIQARMSDENLDDLQTPSPNERSQTEPLKDSEHGRFATPVGRGTTASLATPVRKGKSKEKAKEAEVQAESKAARRSNLVLEIFRRENVEHLWDACCAAESAKSAQERRPELERFTSGHILTRLMSKVAKACGPLKMYEEEYRLLEKLLRQKWWKRGKRADWYTRRALVLERYLSVKKNNELDQENDDDDDTGKKKKKARPKKDREILKKALDGIREALEDDNTHIVSRPDLVRRYKGLEKTLRIPERLRMKTDRELREPKQVQYAGRRVYTTQPTPTSTTTASASGSAVPEKENFVVTLPTGNERADGLPINAELTSYFKRKETPYDPEKEEAAILIANAALKAHLKWKGKSKWRGEGGGEVTVEELALQFYAKRGFNGFHSETRILTTLFALLFWDILFSDVPGAFETKFQAGPLDLSEDSGSFYYGRKDSIERRLKDIEEKEGEARRLVEANDTMYREKNTVCVGVRWDVCGRDELLEVVECIKPETLICICRLFCEDYAARARGVPDLFVWDHGNRECKFVEVKGPGDRPSETQKLWFDTLLNAGADVEICSIVELTFKGVNSKKRKKANQAQVKAEREEEEQAKEIAVVVLDGADSDEYQPGPADEEEEDESPREKKRLRSRSRSMTIEDDDMIPWAPSSP